MGGPSRNNDPSGTPQLSAFTSGDAHNGCRALFNGTAGWAYFGPAGEIDEGALPAGTVSYPYTLKGDKRGLFGTTAAAAGDETAADGAATAAATTGGGGGGAVSRIGWWLRWATSSGGEGGISPAAEAAGGDGLETRSGADGWEVVVSSAPAAAAAAAAGVATNASDGAAHEQRGGGGGGDDDDDATAAPQSVSPNIPRSFRDALMAGAGAGFSDPKAFSRSRAAAAAAAAASSSGAASSPTLVDGGEQGGAVFLWRKAAAGQGGRAADRAKSMLEDEDPYYARKRVGAFAHRTKPRGKAHK